FSTRALFICKRFYCKRASFIRKQLSRCCTHRVYCCRINVSKQPSIIVNRIALYYTPRAPFCPPYRPFGKSKNSSNAILFKAIKQICPNYDKSKNRVIV
uniref:Secreted protein n=1 Tax=Romanomermis culicivorax TaxID=13658 RepID=A0A915K933_ROMCU